MRQVINHQRAVQQTIGNTSNAFGFTPINGSWLDRAEYKEPALSPSISENEQR